MLDASAANLSRQYFVQLTQAVELAGLDGRLLGLAEHLTLQIGNDLLKVGLEDLLVAYRCLPFPATAASLIMTCD